MSNIHSRETAKVYTFPMTADVVRRRMNAQMLADIAGQNLPKVEFGSGWYHSAAIEDEKSQGH
ncbi:MAG: DUF2735 domain-containing protein [Rhizobiaceae bacterium]|nr:DUF2735 domain-containing protein [Rhizobiaceae bacterium]MCO5071341.1 DUF2735 domain-containing protein [Rhizobiaceae bacterium]